MASRPVRAIGKYFLVNIRIKVLPSNGLAFKQVNPSSSLTLYRSAPAHHSYDSPLIATDIQRESLLVLIDVSPLDIQHGRHLFLNQPKETSR